MSDGTPNSKGALGMAYDDSVKAWTSTASVTTNYPQPDRPELPVVGALRNLGEASHGLAKASDDFMAARDSLNAARNRYNECRDIVSKEQEAAGV